MEEVRNVEELMQHFLQKLAIVSNASMLSNAMQDDQFLDTQESLVSLLDRVKLQLRNMRKNIDAAKEELKSLQDTKVKYQKHLKHLEYVTTSVPSRLPTKQCPSKQPSNKKATSKTAVDEDKKPASQTFQTVTKSCQFLDFLTVQEFENVPKYMKGTLTYEKLNCIIEQLDKVFTEKYHILKQRSTTLSEVNRKRLEAFRQQETDEAEGSIFIVEKDIPDLSSLKVDRNVRNALIILRHFSILHEIRGGGIVRFALLSGRY